MRFKIYRSNKEHDDNAPSPCKNAIKVHKEFEEVRYRTDEKGKLIRYVTGKTLTSSRWEIELNTLEDFIALQEEVEAPLIFFGEVDKIEIYDDYREL